MTRALLLAAALAVPCVVLAQDPIGPLERGHRAYRDKDYDTATKLFEEAGHPYWLGRAHFSAKRYGEARKALERWVPKKPKHVNGLIYLGRASLKTGKVKQAVQILDRAHKLAPRNKLAIYWHGVAERKAGRPEKAIMPFTELAMLDPQAAKPRMELGMALLEAGQYDVAATAFKDACERDADNATYWTWLGIAQFRARAYEKARVALVNSLHRNKKDPITHYYMGRVLHEQKNYARAGQAFLTSIKLDPSAANPRLWRARTLLAAGDRNGALSSLKKVAKVTRSGALLAFYGRLLAESGRHDEAEAALKRALTLSPNDSDLMRDLASARLTLGKPAAAIQALQRAVKVDPNDLSAWRQLGGLYSATGKVREARDAYQHLVVGIPKPLPDDLALLGRAELASRNPKSAIQSLTQAIATRSRPDPTLEGDLGIAYYGAGDYGKAVKHLSAAIKALPRDARFQDYEGRALHRLGQRELATVAFTRAVEPQGGEPSGRAYPHRYLALYALEAGRLDLAKTRIRRALQLLPRDVGTREIAGRIALAKKDPNDALTHFSEALRLAPKRGVLALLAGRSAVEAGRDGEAVTFLRRARDLKADPAPTHLWLGRALSKQGRHKDAIAELRAATKLMPKSVGVWLSLSEAQRAAHQLRATVGSLRQAIALEPKNGALREPLVEALRAAGDAAQADEERRAWLKVVFPQLLDRRTARRSRASQARVAAEDGRVPRALRGELFLLRGELLEQQGDGPGARAAYEAADREASWSYRAALAAGKLEAQLGQPKRAMTFLSRAQKRATNRPAPAMAVAEATLRAGRVSDTLEALVAARKRHPGAARPVVELVRLRTLRGEIRAALAVLEAGHKVLDDGTRKELRSSRDFRALWSQGAFRRLLGDPLPSRWSGRRNTGERRLASTGESAYAEAGELIE